MGNFFKRFLKNDNKSLLEYMDQNFNFVSWYPLINQIERVSNKVIVKTTACQDEVDKVQYIASAIFGWANNKQIQDKMIVKQVIILDKDEKQITKFKNPLSKKYFKK